MNNIRFISVLMALLLSLLLSSCINEIHTRKILHANVNCSNLELSKSFYEMLGFVSLSPEIIDIEVSEEPAAGLGMPPYQLRTVPITLMKGFLEGGYVIDLIEW